MAVQLVKRARDIAYAATPELRPISVVLTTLCGYTYAGQPSVAEAMDGTLAGIIAGIEQAYPNRLVVRNPSNPDEDLSERWDTDKPAYRAFVDGIRGVHAMWRELRRQSGLRNVTKSLERLFGEDVSRDVVEKQARELEKNRSYQQISISKTSGLVGSIATSAAVQIPRNTFYGEEENIF